MFPRFGRLLNAISRTPRNCEASAFSLSGESHLEAGKCNLKKFLGGEKSFFHTNLPRMKGWKLALRNDMKNTTKIAGQAAGETMSQIDQTLKSNMFPTVDLPTRIFDGMQFKDIPIVHIKVTKNNTCLGLTDKNIVQLVGSCGREGYKNTRKGTNIAAQTTGTSFGIQAIKRGYKTVRVLVKGFGPGRLSAVKGLQLGGLNIVSITDRTKDFTTFRPKKQKRL